MRTLLTIASVTLFLVACSDSTEPPPAADAASTDHRVEVDSTLDLPPGADLQPEPDAYVPAPEYPENGIIAFESNRQDGRSEIYSMRADGTEVERLTTEGGIVPRFSPDGRWIAYQDPVDFSTWLITPDKQTQKKLHDGKSWFWMSDGTGIVVEVGADYYLVDPETGMDELVFSRGDFTKLENKMFQPSGITGDGRYLVAGSDRYRGGFTGDNGSFDAGFSAIVFDLQDKSKLYFFGNGCAPRTAPAGDSIYHVRGDGETKPDIYRMDVSDLETRSTYQPVVDYADAEWGHTYFPSISTDNKWLVYGASTGCHDQGSCDYEIFVHRLDAAKNQRKRLTEHEANNRHPSLYVPDQ